MPVSDFNTGGSTGDVGTRPSFLPPQPSFLPPQPSILALLRPPSPPIPPEPLTPDDVRAQIRTLRKSQQFLELFRFVKKHRLPTTKFTQAVRTALFRLPIERRAKIMDNASNRMIVFYVAKFGTPYELRFLVKFCGVRLAQWPLPQYAQLVYPTRVAIGRRHTGMLVELVLNGVPLEDGKSPSVLHELFNENEEDPARALPLLNAYMSLGGSAKAVRSLLKPLVKHRWWTLAARVVELARRSESMIWVSVFEDPCHDGVYLMVPADDALRVGALHA